MPRQNVEPLTDFGRRLMRLRKAAGCTQTELVNALGVTQRIVSYYEGHSEFPPASLLPKRANLLGVSADELLGIEVPKKGKIPDTRLQRRMQQIEQLPIKDRRQRVQVIGTYLQAAQLKQSA